MIHTTEIRIKKDMFDLYNHLPNHAYIRLLEDNVASFKKATIGKNKFIVSYKRAINIEGTYIIESNENKTLQQYKFLNPEGKTFCTIQNEECELISDSFENKTCDSTSVHYLSTVKSKFEINYSNIAERLTQHRVDFAKEKFGKGLLEMLNDSLGFFIIKIDFKISPTFLYTSNIKEVSCSSWVQRIEREDTLLKIPFSFKTLDSDEIIAKGIIDAVAVDTKSGKPRPILNKYRYFFFNEEVKL